MATETSSNRTCVLERQILRAICSGAVAKSECQLILEKLRNHRWQEAEHRIVYEALERIPGHDAQFIKTALPAETTLGPDNSRPRDLLYMWLWRLYMAMAPRNHLL